VRGGDRPATRAAHEIGARLHGQLELAVVFVDRDQLEALEPEHHRPEIARTSSLRPHLGPPSEVSRHHEE